jgi:hypothetical protein
MKNRLKNSTTILLIFALSFCTTKIKVENLKENHEDLKTRLLTLPNSLTLYNLDTIQISQQGETIKIDQPTIIVFINVSCITCIGDLDFWLENSKKIQEKSIPLTFILRASDDFYFFKFLVENEKKELAQGSYFFDIYDEFRMLNEDLLLNKTNTFLINQNLEIIISGNPVENRSYAHELFKE